MNSFSQLPKQLQSLIDVAFTTAANPNGGPFKTEKSARAQGNDTHNEGAGFLLASELEGGFITEEDSSEDTAQVMHLPLRLIPSALQLLDLPPDDKEVLSVFKNAVREPMLSASIDDQFVSRDDWRSVCAVLLESRGSEVEGDADSSQDIEHVEVDESGSTSDDYMEEDGSSSNEDSDEYQERASNLEQQRRAPHASASRKQPLSLTAPHNRPTKRQRQTCLETFALFFPDIHSAELMKQKIKIIDLQRASKLLGDTLKAEEMVEMLDMFSTSTDKSMDFDNFSRMMITVQLA